MLALLDDNVFKKEPPKKEAPKEEPPKEEPPKEEPPKEDMSDSVEEDNEDNDKVKKEGGYDDPDVKKIFVKDITPEENRNQLIL